MTGSPSPPAAARAAPTASCPSGRCRSRSCRPTVLDERPAPPCPRHLRWAVQRGSRPLPRQRRRHRRSYLTLTSAETKALRCAAAVAIGHGHFDDVATIVETRLDRGPARWPTTAVHAPAVDEAVAVRIGGNGRERVARVHETERGRRVRHRGADECRCRLAPPLVHRHRQIVITCGVQEARPPRRHRQVFCTRHGRRGKPPPHAPWCRSVSRAAPRSAAPRTCLHPLGAGTWTRICARRSGFSRTTKSTAVERPSWSPPRSSTRAT